MDFSDINSIENTYLFMVSLQHILPCPTCREHYQKYLEEKNIQKYFESKRKLFYWIFKLQNEIKTRNGEKLVPNFEYYLRDVYKKLKVEEINNLLVEDKLRNYRILD